MHSWTRTTGFFLPARAAIIVRRSFLTLVGAALVLLLSFEPGCAHPPRDPETIEFWTLQLSPTFDDYMHSLIAEFERENPGSRVNWIDVPYEGITQKYLSAIAGERPPDLINLPADFVSRYAEMEAVLPLDSLVADSTRRSYLPAALQPLEVRGGLYGLPWYLATKIVIYDRQKLLDSGMGSGVLPRTYGEALQFSRRYHERSGKYAFFYNLVVDSYLFQVLVSEGVPLLDPDGLRAAFDSPEAADVLREWVETFQSGAMPRECIQVGHRGGIDMFQSGSIAFFVGAPQFLRIIKQNAPALYRSADVAPAVVGRSGKAELDVMALCVSRRSGNPQLAAKFAAFVTNAGNQLAFARIVPIFPSITVTLEDPFFMNQDGSLEAKARSLAAMQILNAQVMKPYSRHYQRLQESFKNAMLKAFLGDATAQAALHTAAEQWDKILAEE